MLKAVNYYLRLIANENIYQKLSNRGGLIN